MPSDATHPTSAQSILKSEYIQCMLSKILIQQRMWLSTFIYLTVYGIGGDGLVHRRKAVIFSPLTSVLTETILEDFENASPYFCTFLVNRI